MYKEVLDYIRDLGKERALPEKDRQKERQEEVCKCMNMIADEICRIYGSYGFTWNRDGDKKLFGADYQYVARYLTADMNAASPDPEISIGIYGERSPEKKARYCISIGITDGILHDSLTKDNENTLKDKKKRREKYYSFLNVKWKKDLDLCYLYKNLYGGKVMSDPETIFVHNDKDEELKNDEQKNISRIANKRVESAKNDGKDIELCYLVESETEDGKIRTEGQLKREVINGVGSLLAYYRYVQNYPDNEKDIQPLKTTKNMILYGPPGTGKTYTTAAYAMSVCDRFYTLDVLKELDHSKIMERYHELEQEGRIGFTTFHQSYGYEDFIEGIRPVLDKEQKDGQNQSEEQKPEKSDNLEYTMEAGVFKAFCEKAKEESEKPYVFIIDEINRGNMSKIFGELLMLIERDYRGIKATLAYNGLPFSVPKNLYIIGMMNTADRSLAMIDYALRRRFSFFEIEPGFDSEGFIHYQNGLNNETLNELVSKVKELNREIAADKSLGKGFCIGHSYFCGKDVCTDEWLHSIVDYDILPMLSEYWFDDTSKLRRWENILQGMFQ
jgi:MoxR-like ATPase